MTYNLEWKYRPYCIPETVFFPYKESTHLLEKAAFQTPQPWTRFPASLVTPGYEPTAFVYQSSISTLLPFLLVIALGIHVAPTIARYVPVGVFPKLIPVTLFNTRNWFLFAHRGK